MEKIIIDLDLHPANRWDQLESYQREIDELIGYYLEDLGDVSFFEEAIDFYKQTYVPKEYLEEINGVRKYCNFTENQLLITNLYYDALKFVFGCTSFSYLGQKERFHARNLDWWSEKNALKEHSKIFHFKKANEIIYSSVGWPGFIGILSGMRVNAYSITLNAVLSDESPNFALPVTLLIRQVLEFEEDFDSAVKSLCETPIASDCLLMIVGKEADQACVIERTPTNFAIRSPENNQLIVTNDYKKLNGVKLSNDVLQDTSCGRYDKVKELVSQDPPGDEAAYFQILSNQDVKMNITVQQMVFNITKNKIMLK